MDQSEGLFNYARGRTKTDVVIVEVFAVAQPQNENIY